MIHLNIKIHSTRQGACTRAEKKQVAGCKIQNNESSSHPNSSLQIN